jgi:hypothetical protein
MAGLAAALAWSWGVAWLSGAGRAALAAGGLEEGVGLVAGVARATVVRSALGFRVGSAAEVGAGLAARISRVSRDVAASGGATAAGTARGSGLAAAVSLAAFSCSA